MRGSSVLQGLSLALRVVVVTFMLTPVILVAVLSFSNEKLLTFPPDVWGTNQYRSFFASDYWLSAIGTSLWIALQASLIALVVGTLAVLGAHRSRLPLKTLVLGLGLAPLILPVTAYAVALYVFFTETHMLGSMYGLVFADAVLVLPFVVIVVTAGIMGIPRELELVAMTLGASRTRAQVGITVRLLMPALVSAFALCFVFSFGEAVLVNFLAGPDLVTLPKGIFESLRTGADPAITAIATVLVFATGILMAIASYPRRAQS